MWSCLAESPLFENIKINTQFQDILEEECIKLRFEMRWTIWSSKIVSLLKQLKNSLHGWFSSSFNKIRIEEKICCLVFLFYKEIEDRTFWNLSILPFSARWLQLQHPTMFFIFPVWWNPLNLTRTLPITYGYILIYFGGNTIIYNKWGVYTTSGLLCYNFQKSATSHSAGGYRAPSSVILCSLSITTAYNDWMVELLSIFFYL